MNFGTRALAAALIGAAVFGTAACMGPASLNGADGRDFVLSMGTGEAGGTVFLAGAAVASAVNNEAAGISVKIETSKGSPVNAKNVHEGNLDLAMVSADAAYDAWSGTGSFEGEKKEKLCALAACYPEVSQWIALESAGISFVHELKGRCISAGPDASKTAAASAEVFSVMGMDEENTEIYFSGLSEGAGWLREESADSVHGFTTAPFGPFEALAGEKETVILQYTEEELSKLLASGGPYVKITLPAETYRGQKEPVETFGIKVLLCASTDMEESLAYEIAKAMDESSAAYTGGHRFMAFMQDKEFLCRDIPIPLHPGAERYYREKGYLK